MARTEGTGRITVEHYGPQGRSAWMDVDWREHQRWVQVAGRPVNVIELGPSEGEAVVFVHGLSGSWQNWLENLPHFAAAGFHCLAVDLPGFGASPMPASKITITRYAELLDELLGQLEIDAAMVVGNSMGGFIGAELAIRFPRRVERLVLVAAAGISVQKLRNDPGMALLHRLDFLVAAHGGWLASKSDAWARRRKLRRQLFAIVAAHPGLLPAPLVAESLKGSGKPGFIPAVEALTTYPIEDRLTEIACPTLIVWGDKDKLVPVKDADVFESLIPDARKVVYRDTGHVAMLERPAHFNDLVQRFLLEAPNEDVDTTQGAAAAS